MVVGAESEGIYLANFPPSVDISKLTINVTGNESTP